MKTFRAGQPFSPLLILALLLSSARAEMPSTRLLTLNPPGGKAGSTVEVTVSGSDLENLGKAWVSQPGISATIKTSKVFRVKISAGTPPGVYDFRVTGKYGASNPRSFSVGLAQELPQAEENTRPEKAQRVPFGATVNGRAHADTIDFYRFTARKGDFVVVRCEARQIDSRLEPVLLLADAQGRELARSRDGSSLGWLATGDGEFTASVHDSIFRGGPEYFYRLSIGSFPRMESILPVASAAARAVRFVVTGHNLPGGGKAGSNRDPALEMIEIELSPGDPRVRPARVFTAAQAREDLFECRLKDERGVSDPVLLTLAPEPVRTAVETNYHPKQAQTVSVPVEIAGQFAPNRKPAWFSFESPKGGVYWMELLSQQLGFPSDPFLLVQRAAKNQPPEDVVELKGVEENIGGPSFNTKSLDPGGRFEARDGGSYRIEIKDQFTQVAGSPRPAYRLVIRKPEPDFQLVAMPSVPLPPQKDGKQLPVSTLTLRRGGVAPLRVLAFRRDGFSGEIELSLNGLPEGVAFSPAKIEKGKTGGLILLHADEKAAAATAAFTVTGTADIEGAKITRQARPQTLVWNTDDYNVEAPASRSCDECVVSSLAEDQPVRLRPLESKPLEGVSGEKLLIPLTMERMPGVTTDGFSVTPFGPAALDEGKELQIDAKATNVTYELDLKKQRFPPGSYTFALGGHVKAKREQSKGGDAEFTLYSAPITLRIKAASTNSPAK